MAKRGYKLQEFVAHSANVNCLKIGKKTRRNFITGGDDEKVNLWSIGKPTATTSLSGHTSPIESVAFDSAEVLVAAGASSGVIKLWDLEETKVVRTLNGHRSYCTSLEFHPFGEFFASGSMDTNLKIWDIRKKGCIHTYKGHRRAVSTIRFSPDGRWVVSGGLDNVVKIWDLTAGKLLHEFNFHEGHIRSMDFHPLEFLLATGSSDKTVKFWDLETFELIGSTRPEATGVRSVTFHPDGRTLFCGLDGSLKVYSWEPVICHDALDMGWSTLGDLCIDDGKLLGCSYYQNSVAVWVADTSLIEPHVHSILPEENARMQAKLNRRQDLKERGGSPRRSTIPPDDDTKDIKNIYVDSMTPVVSRKSGSVPAVVNPQIYKETDNMSTNKQVPAAKFIASREPVTNELENIAVSVKPSHRRRPSTTKLDIEVISKTVESGLKTGSDTVTVANFQRRLVPDAEDSANEKASISTCVTKEFPKASYPDKLQPENGSDTVTVANFQRRLVPDAEDSANEKASISTRVKKELPKASYPDKLLPENGDRPDESNKESKPVKYVNGVAVVHGRTRSLVERFEKREKLNTNEIQISDQTVQVSTNTDVPTPRINKSFNTVPCAMPEAITSEMPAKTPAPDVVLTNTDVPTPRVNKSFNTVPCVMPEAKTSEMPVKTPAPDVVASKEPEAKTPKISVTTADVDNPMPVVVTEAKTLTTPEKAPDVVSNLTAETKSFPVVTKPDVVPIIKSEEARFSPLRSRTTPSTLPPEKGKFSPVPRSLSSRRVMQERGRPSPMLVTRRSNASPRVMPERTKTSPMVAAPRHETPNRMISQKAKSSPLLDDGPQTTGRGLMSKKGDDILDDLMQNHGVFISSLRSRLTKLQVIRHFWEQSDTRGAINALRKLPDHAVQADVVNVLTERMESLTLDHFPSLLPVLLDLLDSKTERHINVSLELLLKLVAVFGPVISSTISAPPAVGVDLHAEKRLECCNECHIQLQKIHKCLPDIIRRGGLAARCAQELDIILQK